MKSLSFDWLFSHLSLDPSLDYLITFKWLRLRKECTIRVLYILKDKTWKIYYNSKSRNFKTVNGLMYFINRLKMGDIK